MKVRTKAFLQVFGYFCAAVGAILLLEYFFGKYGFMIYMGALVLYMMYCLYNIRVSMLEREQEKIVNILKE
jgi:hypothetical protein